MKFEFNIEVIMTSIAVILALFTAIPVSLVGCLPSAPNETKCDNSQCTEPVANKLNIHLVPHTHDDVGWWKTVDQLYYGSNNQYQKAGVQYILDSVVKQLVADKQRKFIYVEMAFFWKWWKLQDDATKEMVKGFVNEGRLEFTNGGWTMNDEASCHYSSIIDQMTWGHRRLTDEFGTCGIPKIGWQIDPFGHSREQANLFAQMNFDGVFFSREDYQDERKRMKEKTLEMVWQGSDDLGRDSDIFTHMMIIGYGTPSGFSWELIGGNDDPFIDDPESEDYNVDAIVEKFITFVKKFAKHYATNNVLLPMGNDFNYQAAGPWYKNLDKLIKYVNQNQSEVNAFYSTPTCYLHAVHQANHTFTTKSDDFFPYASDPHTYWTGYFTSRPALKRYEKVGNNLLQICKQIDSLNLFGDKYEKEITSLREWMGVLQHHDAITGTEKQHVANNYALKLYKSIEKCKSVINEGLKKLMAKSEPKTDQIFCQNLNISASDVTEGTDTLAVTIYNPIGRDVQYLVRLPVTDNTYEVMDSLGKPIKSDIVPIPDFVLDMKERVSKAKDELVFEAEVPALGFATYFVKPNKDKKLIETNVTKITESFSVKSKTFDIMFGKEGKLNEIQLKSGKVMKLSQEFDYYKAMAGDNHDADHRASGAYIFRPDGQTPQPYDPKEFEAKLVQTSNGLTEIHQKISSYISQVITINPNEDFISIDYTIGPIPVEDKVGKEIIARFDTDLVTDKTFYTDANGRQLMKRVRDFRPTWNLTVTEPTACNYYPVHSRIVIRDEKQDIQMTLLNDRSQGGSSLKDGSIELMVHRRDLFDDHFGVWEALNEPGFDGKGLVIRGKFWLLISSIEDSAQLHRDLAQRIFMEPLITFSKITSIDDYLKDHKTQYSGLTKELPKNIHLLTLEQWRDGSYLVRLEHFYQTNESKELSKPVTIDLKDLFQSFEITEAVEMTLTATEEKKSAKRLKFNNNSKQNRFEPQIHDFNTNDLSVTLNPMDIKTFVVKIKSK